MSSLVINSLYIFFIVLEVILFANLIMSWLPKSSRFKEFLLVLLEPILSPIRYLLKHSIFNTKVIDLAPMIALVVILFFQNLFYFMK